MLNTQMGRLPNAFASIGNLPVANNAQATQGPVGPLVQDRDRNEATRTRVTSDQRSSVYIGQVYGDIFVKHILMEKKPKTFQSNYKNITG